MAMAPTPAAAPQQQPVASPPPPSQQVHLQPQPADNDRSSGELRAVDCNLASLCEHIQMEGFNSGAFSDIVVQAMGSSYRLHRLILSRSSYFRNMLHGPWKEAESPTVVLQIDDSNVNSEAIAVALAYLYGHHPKLNDSNAFRVLAAASFLDLQDLCAICTDFIISELWTSNFLAYQVFAESQDYGIYGERVRNACWGYLCQSATKELREVLPKLSSQTLNALLTSDELWVPNEERRFELAFYTLLAKAALSEVEHSGSENSNSENIDTSDSPEKISSGQQQMESELQNMSMQENLLEKQKTPHNIFVELPDGVLDLRTDIPCTRSVQGRQASSSSQGGDPRYSLNIEQPAALNSSTDANAVRVPCSYVESLNGAETAKMGGSEAAMEGPSGESPPSQLSTSVWLPRESRESFSTNPMNGAMANDWGRCNIPIWGGRIVGRRQVKSANGSPGIRDEEYDSFLNIFEGGSLLYCNMSFEALLNVRKQLEEFGFPCNAVNDGLWLQMLLYHRVQAIVADTCKNCCLATNACQCRQAYGYSHGNSQVVYYRQEHDRSSTNTMGNVYIAEGEGSGLFGPVRVHVRGAIDGLAGIGRGPTYVQGSGDGLTALVGLSQGSNIVHVRGEQTERVYEADPNNRFAGSSHPNASGISVQMLESQEYPLGLEWENSEGSLISLDLKTPLRHFPPFRFGVEFEDVHRLSDGQVKHSPEVFYAGSLWKVSVQAFSDEDPQGRRTLGLFLHRRKAEMTDSLRKVHMFIDSREKVTARYQLICPSKREVMVFGSFKQAGTLLPKAPKGWGWRTALLFDELADLLQGGALRVAAVVQIV